MVNFTPDQARYRPLLPAPQEARKGTPKKKRRLTRIACNNCRTKKLGCDGKRPCKPCANNGIHCVYISKDSSETPQMVLRREIEVLRTERCDLRELLDYLCSASDAEAQITLQRLRSESDMMAVLASVKTTPHGHQEMPVSRLDGGDAYTPPATSSTVSDHEAWQQQPVKAKTHMEVPLPPSLQTATFTRSWVDAQMTNPSPVTNQTMFEAPGVVHPPSNGWPTYQYPTFTTDAAYMQAPIAMSFMPNPYDDRMRGHAIPYHPASAGQ